MPNLTNSQEPEPHFFGPMEPEPEPLEKKYQESEPEPIGEKNKEPEPFGKSQEPEPLKINRLLSPVYKR